MDLENSLAKPVNTPLTKLKELQRILDWKLVSLFILPIVLSLINYRWLFSELYPTDPWFYYGYFLDLKHHLNAFSGSYYGTRLPWILPGFLAYKLFPSTIAACVLHFSFFYAAIFSVFTILKKTICEKTAFLTAILMGCYIDFLYTMGSNYIDGAGITYLLLTLLMLAPSVKPKKPFKLRLFVAGIFCSCFLFTQIFLAVTLPLIGIYFFFLNRPHTIHSILKSLGYFFWGIFALTLCLCCINYLLSGEFLFFTGISNGLNAVSWTTTLGKDQNMFFRPLYGRENYLLIPLCIFFTSILTLILQRTARRHPKSSCLLFFQALFILNMLMFIYLQFVKHHPVLSYIFYASYLYPLMFLALGGQLAIALHKTTRKQYYVAIGVVVLTALLGFIFHETILSNKHSYLSRKSFHWKHVILILFGTIGLTCLFLKRATSKMLAIFFISLSFAVINRNYSVRSFPSLAKAKRDVDANDARNHQKGFLAIYQSIQAIKKMDPEGRSPIWYNNQTYSTPISLDEIFNAICSARVWGYRMFNMEFPKVPSMSKTHRQPGQVSEKYHGELYLTYGETRLMDSNATPMNIFILSNSQEPLKEANRELATIGFKGDLINEEVFLEGDLHYKITFIKVSKLQDS